MSPRIRSLICFTSSGVPVATARIPSKWDRAHEGRRPGRRPLPCWSMVRSPPSRTTISAWCRSGKTPRSDGRTAPVGVVDEEVHERGVVDASGTRPSASRAASASVRWRNDAASASRSAAVVARASSRASAPRASPGATDSWSAAKRSAVSGPSTAWYAPELSTRRCSERSR